MLSEEIGVGYIDNNKEQRKAFAEMTIDYQCMECGYSYDKYSD